MSWDLIELDFGLGGETANFGTRHDSGTALFQVNTLATISHSSHNGKSIPVPEIAACASPVGMCVGVDNQATFFDEGCQRLNSTISLESLIDVASWTDNLPLLVVGERNGSFHFIHTGLSRVIFSQSLLPGDEGDPDQKFFHGICIVEDNEGYYILLLLTARSVLYKFSNLNLKGLTEGDNEFVQAEYYFI